MARKQFSAVGQRGALPARQSGVALFISLVLLLVLTIIGVSSVQTTSLEVRMTRNEHDTMLAFQAAESALEDGEAIAQGLSSPATFTEGGANGRYIIAPMGQQEHFRNEAAWAANGQQAPTFVDGVAEQPQYIIEHIASVTIDMQAHQLDDPYAGGADDRVDVYRITARGVGGTAQSRVTLQSIYGQPVD